jgi:hypothetical protein
MSRQAINISPLQGEAAGNILLQSKLNLRMSNDKWKMIRACRGFLCVQIFKAMALLL